MNELKKSQIEVGAWFLMFNIFEGNPRVAAKMSQAINRNLDLSKEQDLEEGLDI